MPPILDKRTSWRRADAKPCRSDLTTEEQDHVRRALRVLSARVGGMPLLAKAMGVNYGRLAWAMGKTGKPGAALALYAARLAHVPMEDLLAGAWPKPGACPTCGQIVGSDHA
jgi:hypothetical protein